MKKIVRSPFAEVDLTLDAVMEIGGGKQYTWVFRVPKNASKLIITASHFPEYEDGKIKYGYSWETLEPVKGKTK